MTRDEAKLLLQAHRPNGQDDTHPLFPEALALAASDPELKMWWDAQQNFDRKVAAKLEEIPVPADLRERILQSRKIVAFPQRSYLPYWIAAAALIAILLVGKEFLVPTATPLASNDYDAAVLPYLGNDNPSLAMLSPDHQKVVDWLKQRSSPTGELPPSLVTLPSVGCQTLDVRGHSVSLICFTMPSGSLAHLFIVEKQALANPPPLATPQFSQRPGGWSMAEWSDGKMSYVLATKAGPDKLRELL